MNSSSKLALWVIAALISLVFISKLIFNLIGQKPLIGGLSFSQKWSFNFICSKNQECQKDNEHKNDPELAKIIEAELSGKEGKYAIFIETLATDSATVRYRANTSEIFPSASLYKIFLIAAVVDKVDKGQLTYTQKLSSTQDHLQDVLGFKEYGYEEVGEEIGFSVEQALSRVARLSDNYASIILAEKIGWNAVSESAKRYGANATVIKSPISTTADDVAKFFIKTYKCAESEESSDHIYSQSSCQKILELLKLSQLNNRIPAGLPDDIEVAHKTAELSQIRHDAGIVYAKRPYLIILMAKDLKGEDDAVETLASISKAVYDYLEKQQ